MTEDRTAEIQQLLDTIAQEKDVTIIHAIESGSRAWGFPSADSDYDIRFIYHHPQSWYLSPFEKKDTINLAISDDLDAGGWDIGKCMRLLYKGNAPLYEWLCSPVVYRQQLDKYTLLKDLAVEAFNPAVAFYHYMSLAKKKLLGGKTKHHAKSYLYALRALLCANWVADKGSIPSVDALPLIKRYMADSDLHTALLQLIADKATQKEKDKTPLPQVLLDFADRLYESLRANEPKAKRLRETEKYDRVMREIIGT